MDLILVRHGRDIRTSPSRPLSDTGVEQAAAVGQWLADRRPTELWSGSLDRASDTANVIARVLGVTPLVDGRLDEIENTSPANLSPPHERSPWQQDPHAEDWASFRIRVGAFLSDLCRAFDMACDQRERNYG